MLIDAGGNFNYEISAENIKTYHKTSAEYLHGIGIKTLDMVVVSNPGNTNIGGMTEILNNFTIGELIQGGDPPQLHSILLWSIAFLNQTEEYSLQNS